MIFYDLIFTKDDKNFIVYGVEEGRVSFWKEQFPEYRVEENKREDIPSILVKRERI